jgi:hypothetical protein
MKAHRSVLYSPKFLVIFTLISLSIIGVSANRTSNKKQDDIQERLKKVIEATDVNNLTITNKTSAFNIINAEKMPEGIIHLTLQNGYNKSITAYQFSIGNTKTLVDSLFTIHNESVAPGKSKDEFLAIDIDPELKRKGIVILAVVFDDSTSDGYADSIREIQDYRLGEQKQIERLNDFLNDNSILSIKSHLDILSEMQTKMLSVSEDTGADFPKYVQFGIQDTKQRMSRQIEKIVANRDENTEKKFAAFLEYIKEKTLILRVYTEAIKINNNTQ